MVLPVHSSPQALRCVVSPASQEKEFLQLAPELLTLILQYVPTLKDWHSFALVSRQTYQLIRQAKLELFAPLTGEHHQQLIQYLFVKQEREDGKEDPPLATLIRAVLAREIQKPQASKALTLLLKGDIYESNLTPRDLHALGLNAFSAPHMSRTLLWKNYVASFFPRYLDKLHILGGRTFSAPEIGDVPLWNNWASLAKEVDHATAYFLYQSTAWPDKIDLDAVLPVEVGNYFRENLHAFLIRHGIDRLDMILTISPLQFLAVLFKTGFLSKEVFSVIVNWRFRMSEVNDPERFYLCEFHEINSQKPFVNLMLVHPFIHSVPRPESKVPRHDRERHLEDVRGLFGH